MKGQQSLLIYRIIKVKLVILNLFYYLLCVQAAYAQSPTNGLVAHWAFDEGTGTTAQDSTGQNNTGTLINGPSWVTGRSGNALSFDGINDYVEINDNNNLDLTAEQFTLSAWIYPESFGEALNGRIIDHGGGSAGEGGWCLLINNAPNYQNLRQSIKNGNSSNTLYSNIGSISLDTWQHVAVTLESGTITFYVNGQIKGQASGVPTPTDRNAPIRIGMRATDFLRAFTGIIDEVLIYERALPYQEIMDLFNQAPVSPPVISNGQPVGILPLETTTATLSVTTDKAATCKYATVPDTPYSSMPGTFSSTDGTTHSNLISGLEYLQSRTYYVKCRDQNGDSNPTDYPVSFHFNRTVYSVSPSGSDDNPGTEVLPLKTIQHAIDSASRNNSDVTIIKVAQGTYYENISIVCCSSRNNWRLLGGWSSDFSVRDENPYNTVIDGGGSQRVIKINVPALNMTIEGFSIMNGFDSASGGGIAVFPFYDGTVTLNLVNNIIARNSSGSAGGGIYVSSKEYATTTLTLTDNVIAHNNADDICGGVCVISENHADTTVTFTGNTVIDNRAGYEGGGIYLRSYSGAVITSIFTNNAITHNSAAYLGAGIYLYSESDAVMTADFIYNRITGNTGANFGGGAYLHSLSDSMLTASFSNNTISGNSSAIHGGGIYALSTLGAAITSSFSNNIITGNSTVYDGGGVFSWGSTTSAFTNNIIAGNSASRGAGVFATEGTALSFLNDTITGNSAEFLGGGIYALHCSSSDICCIPDDAANCGDETHELPAVTSVNIINTIVFGNTAVQGGNGFYIESAYEQSPTFAEVNASYSDVDNYVYDPDYPGIYNDLGNNLSQDPLFKNAANMDYHLLSSSPLINKGDNSAVTSIDFDFEEEPRIFDGIVDIGADEDVFSIIKPPTEPEININGDLSEFADADSITFSSSEGDTFTVKSLWDSNALYLGYEVIDKKLNASISETTRDGNVKSEDSVGWVIDTLNNDSGSGDPNAPYMLDDDYQGLVNIKNAKYDSKGTPSGAPTSSWNGIWQSAVQYIGTIDDNSDMDTGYTVEVKIPWTTLGFLHFPDDDTAVRIGFLLNDKDDSYCDVVPTGSYIDAENYTGTINNAGNFSTLTAQGGYIGSSYIKTLLPAIDSYWENADAPAHYVNDASQEQGVKFTTDVAGYIHGIRFYKGVLNTGTHTSHLWSSNGTLLASATFSGETASGWQQVNFSSPVAIAANTTYTASYHMTSNYSLTEYYFNSAKNNSPIHFPQNAGVYKYTSSVQFPNQSYAGDNYWVDVVFSTSAALPACADISGREYKKYDLDVPAGTYKIWLRGYATVNADTVLVGVDGSCIGTYQFNTKNQWSWSNTAISGSSSTGALSAGSHHIDIWTRQADVLIDGIYLTTGAETPTDSSHGTALDPGNCSTTSHVIWPEGGGTAFDNASHWQEIRLAVITHYYCDYDHDGYIASSPSDTCLGTECQPANCQTVPGTDCDDNDFYDHPDQSWYKDSDNDDYSDGTADQISCSRPPGYKTYLELSTFSGDCDDTNRFISPEASEIWYDGVDQDCNGLSDYDQDADGYNSVASGGTDCDDIDSVLNPDTKWYPDFDGDTYGNPTYAFVQCNEPSGPPGYVLVNSDCDDHDTNIYPGGPEVRIMNQPVSYYWIDELQTAYNDSANGETIQCKVATYRGNLILGQNKYVIMKGGYDCAYSHITGTTTLEGNMESTDGSLTVEDFELQSPMDDWNY